MVSKSITSFPLHSWIIRNHKSTYPSTKKNNIFQTSSLIVKLISPQSIYHFTIDHKPFNQFDWEQNYKIRKTNSMERNEKKNNIGVWFRVHKIIYISLTTELKMILLAQWLSYIVHNYYRAYDMERVLLLDAAQFIGMVTIL